MVGQNDLIKELDRLIGDDMFPRFSIVLGERGMEHEDVAHYVADKMDALYLVLQDVKVDTIRQMIKQAYSLHETTVFCIPHADDMSVNAKNAMLKVAEEAPNRAYIIMCLEDLSNTLATIQSRAQIFRMDRCKPDDIKEFASSLCVTPDTEFVKVAGEVCRTPGEVYMLSKMGATNFHRYVEWVADNLTTMPSADIFKISDKLALKDEEDKYDCKLFLIALQNEYMKRVCKMPIGEDTCTKYCMCEMARVVGQYLQDFRVKGINKAMLLNQCYLDVRKVWKSTKSNNT